MRAHLHSRAWCTFDIQLKASSPLLLRFPAARIKTRASTLFCTSLSSNARILSFSVRPRGILKTWSGNTRLHTPVRRRFRTRLILKSGRSDRRDLTFSCRRFRIPRTRPRISRTSSSIPSSWFDNTRFPDHLLRRFRFRSWRLNARFVMMMMIRRFWKWGRKRWEKSSKAFDDANEWCRKQFCITSLIVLRWRRRW